MNNELNGKVDSAINDSGFANPSKDPSNELMLMSDNYHTFSIKRPIHNTNQSLRTSWHSCKLTYMYT